MLEITPTEVFNIRNSEAFEKTALELFQYQAENVSVYKEFIKHLGISVENIDNIFDIPFMPIEFFKHNIVLDQKTHNDTLCFSSSGTTGTINSKHFVPEPTIYEQSFLKAFKSFYGEPSDYIFLALLPSYLERSGSSLIYMCERLIKDSFDERSGFYLNEFSAIKEIIENNTDKKVFLIGVTYALLDFAEQLPFAMKNTIVLETGGMKGKRKELLRADVHKILTSAFQLNEIHSEYGMTELLSQAYSNGQGIFKCPSWMKILIREVHDPLSYTTTRTGGINVIDLANIHSCAFIATQDLGRKISEEEFEVLGRFDNSDIRGCNLLVS
jgi:phenylacetate-coenzyme A ligase PaaK-like adenylate-forming protein